jgi:hypothetical protein
MIRLISICLLSVITTTAWAGTKHKAHHHGHGQLAIAIDGLKVQFLLEAPTEAIWGFEHQAKTDKEKAKIKEIEDKVTKSPETLVSAPVGCTKETSKLEQHQSGSHNDVEITMTFQCQAPLTGATAEVRFIKEFPGLKSLKTQVISESGQKGLTITKPVETIKL